MLSMMLLRSHKILRRVSSPVYHITTSVRANWSERSACIALGRCSGTQCPLFLGLFFFLSFPSHILFSQKGLSQGSETLHGVLSHKKNKIWGNKNIFVTPKSRVHSLTLPPSDMCAKQIPLASMGGRAHTREQEPPSASVEFLKWLLSKMFLT